MNPSNHESSDRLVREAERKSITSISRTTAWQLERKGAFSKTPPAIPTKQSCLLAIIRTQCMGIQPRKYQLGEIND